MPSVQLSNGVILSKYSNLHSQSNFNSSKHFTSKKSQAHSTHRVTYQVESLDVVKDLDEPMPERIPYLSQRQFLDQVKKQREIDFQKKISVNQKRLNSDEYKAFVRNIQGYQVDVNTLRELYLDDKI